MSQLSTKLFTKFAPSKLFFIQNFHLFKLFHVEQIKNLGKEPCFTWNNLLIFKMDTFHVEQIKVFRGFCNKNARFRAFFLDFLPFLLVLNLFSFSLLGFFLVFWSFLIIFLGQMQYLGRIFGCFF